MPRPPRWKEIPDGKGGVVVTLSSWKIFTDYITEVLCNDSAYVYRGHRSNEWQLESTIDRALRRIPIADRERILGRHLEAFRYAARSRRGPNPLHLGEDNDWWALGQHHGLLTPLLDFTESPFVGLYFAFEKEGGTTAEFRSVWVLSWITAEDISWNVLAEMGDNSEIGRGPICEIV